MKKQPLHTGVNVLVIYENPLLDHFVLALNLYSSRAQRLMNRFLISWAFFRCHQPKKHAGAIISGASVAHHRFRAWTAF